jgi:hypothetical protein
MKFTGSTHVTLAAPFGTTFTATDLTVEAWVKFKNFTHTPTVVANSKVTTYKDGFQLVVNSGGTSGYFAVGSGTEGCAKWTSTTHGTLVTTKWYFYVGTYNQSTVNTYINGQLVASQAVKTNCTITAAKFTGSKVTAPSSSCTKKVIGIGWNPCSEPTTYVTGLIADVGIFNTGLTGTQIEKQYQQATA